MRKVVPKQSRNRLYPSADRKRLDSDGYPHEPMQESDYLVQRSGVKARAAGNFCVLGTESTYVVRSWQHG